MADEGSPYGDPAGDGEDITLVLPTADTGAMQVFLDHVAASRQAGVHLAMVLDGAGWHIGGQLRVPPTSRWSSCRPTAPNSIPSNAYMRGQVVDHQKTVQLLVWRVDQRQNAAFQRSAAETLPPVLDHLRVARTTLDKLAQDQLAEAEPSPESR